MITKYIYIVDSKQKSITKISGGLD